MHALANENGCSQLLRFSVRYGSRFASVLADVDDGGACAMERLLSAVHDACRAVGFSLSTPAEGVR